MNKNSDNKIHCLDDHIPTDEELLESLADVPLEQREKWRKDFEEWLNKKKSEN